MLLVSIKAVVLGLFRCNVIVFLRKEAFNFMYNI